MDQKQKKEKLKGSTRLVRIPREQIQKVISNDSPEIPGRGETSEIPGIPSGRTTSDIK